MVIYHGTIRKKSTFQVRHEKNPPTFYYTGWLIGILIRVYYNALFSLGSIILYITQPTKVFFIAPYVVVETRFPDQLAVQP